MGVPVRRVCPLGGLRDIVEQLGGIRQQRQDGSAEDARLDASPAQLAHGFDALVGPHRARFQSPREGVVHGCDGDGDVKLVLHGDLS